MITPAQALELAYNACTGLRDNLGVDHSACESIVLDLDLQLIKGDLKEAHGHTRAVGRW